MKYYIVVLATIIVAWSSVAQAGNFCPGPWTHFNGSCYRFLNQKHKGWRAASNHCQKLTEPVGNGHLVTYGSPDERKFVRDWWVNILYPIKGVPQHMWIGGNDITGTSAFIFEDGNPLMDINEPSFDITAKCLRMTISHPRKEGSLGYVKCNEKSAYMCEYTL